jgi:hypothetical protein
LLGQLWSSVRLMTDIQWANSHVRFAPQNGRLET